MNSYHESKEKRVLKNRSNTSKHLNKMETEAGKMGEGVEQGKYKTARGYFCDCKGVFLFSLKDERELSMFKW